MFQTKILIKENGCTDDEIKVLDTKIPYFYQHIKRLFIQEPEGVQIILIGSKDEFQRLNTENRTKGAFLKGNTIYIYEPHLLGSETKIQRKDFYRILYQELIYLFYKTNRRNN
jgi:hypothetical protein